MCKHCNKSSCSGGCKKSSAGKDLASLQNLISELSTKLEKIAKDTSFLDDGHPIMMLQNADDIALFSFDSGLGSKKWEGWAICNGGTYQNAKSGLDFVVPNLLNRFPVAAGDQYDVNDTGGLDGVALSIPELPVHNHTITDPGHSHDITDPGHNHGASSAAHTHNITTTPHNHVTESAGSHIHDTHMVDAYSYSTGLGYASLGQADLGSDSLINSVVDPAGSHTHNISNTTVAASAESTAVAVTVSNAFIGITETEVHETNLMIDDTGEGEEHENRPPYYAVLFIMKL